MTVRPPVRELEAFAAVRQVSAQFQGDKMLERAAKQLAAFYDRASLRQPEHRANRHRQIALALGSKRIAIYDPFSRERMA